MKKRIKLADRLLPNYTNGEEAMNMVTHIIGGGFSILALILGLWKAYHTGFAAMVAMTMYGISMTAVYCISSIYHGLQPSTGKKVLQIIDHCMIYALIAGTYTPILTIAFVPTYPFIGWGLLATEWGLGILAATLTAIDLKKYNFFSMTCYLFMGWAIIFFIPQSLTVLTAPGFWVLFSGGCTYTVGAILYGIGAKKHWMHSIFHIFVLIGSILQFLSIYLFVL